LRLALGTAQFGLPYGIANQNGQIPRVEVKKILEHAFASGFNTLDTAIAYGQSEECLGEVGVSDWSVVSKLPAIPDGCSDVRQWVVSSVQMSLHRMGIKRLYGLLLHRPQQLLSTQGEELFRAMEILKLDGILEKTGVSVYGSKELDSLTPYYRFDLVQAPFNVLDQGLLTSGWMKRMVDEGTELHIRSLFLQGLLLMPAHARPERFLRWANIWKVWDEWVIESGLTPLQACLRYALHFIEVSKAIVGVDNVQQLMQIIEAVQGDLDISIPSTLISDDINLINPSRWNGL